jgi:hypothetical protein
VLGSNDRLRHGASRLAPYRHIREQIEAGEPLVSLSEIKKALQSPALLVKPVAAGKVSLQQGIVNKKYILNINML